MLLTPPGTTYVCAAPVAANETNVALQVTAPPMAKDAPAHALQTVAPVELLYVLDGQEMHAAEPVVDWYFPAGHERHAVLPTELA